MKTNCVESRGNTVPLTEWKYHYKGLLVECTEDYNENFTLELRPEESDIEWRITTEQLQ